MEFPALEWGPRRSCQFECPQEQVGVVDFYRESLDGVLADGRKLLAKLEGNEPHAESDLGDTFNGVGHCESG
jgi:hypothetical protein